MTKKILFALIPLILAAGIIPFSSAKINEDSECREDRVLVYRVIVEKYACVFETTSSFWESLGISEIIEKSDTLSPAEAEKIAEDAYIYGYPLVIMELTQFVSTNVADAGTQRAPINQFAHFQEFPTPDFTDVVRPNADTLYSLTWLDLADEPIILHVPDTNDRYYLMQIMDAYTNVFSSIGSRTTGTEANDFAIVGPFWDGTLPEGIDEIKSPTNMVWIVGRTQTNGVSDYEAVNNIQKQYTLTPLNSFGELYQPPQNVPVDSERDMITPPVRKIDEADPNTFFNTLAILMKDNPPAPEDADLVSKFVKIGLISGEKFDSSKLNSEIIDAIETGANTGRQKISDNVENIGIIQNGWIVHLELGNYGTDYILRASVALFGLGANLPDDAIYPFTVIDGNGNILNGANNYVMHFPDGQTPPVNAFWSITVYESDFFSENSINRYAIGDRDELEFNEDGSLDIYIQHEMPEGNESNWLPAPEGDFDLTMRVYWPQQEAFDGTWKVPPVQNVE